MRQGTGRLLATTAGSVVDGVVFVATYVTTCVAIYRGTTDRGTRDWRAAEAMITDRMANGLRIVLDRRLHGMRRGTC